MQWMHTGLSQHYAIMVESKSCYVHPVQSWWSIAILALAVGKRTGLLVGVRYIYLRKNVEIWWGVKRCIFDICTEGFNIKPEILYCSLFRILRK